MISCLGIAVSLSCFLLGYIMMYNWTPYNFCEVVTLRIKRSGFQTSIVSLPLCYIFTFMLVNCMLQHFAASVVVQGNPREKRHNSD